MAGKEELCRDVQLTGSEEFRILVKQFQNRIDIGLGQSGKILIDEGTDELLPGHFRHANALDMTRKSVLLVRGVPAVFRVAQ